MSPRLSQQVSPKRCYLPYYTSLPSGAVIPKLGYAYPQGYAYANMKGTINGNMLPGGTQVNKILRTTAVILKLISAYY